MVVVKVSCTVLYETKLRRLKVRCKKIIFYIEKIYEIVKTSPDIHLIRSHRVDGSCYLDGLEYSENLPSN